MLKQRLDPEHMVKVEDTLREDQHDSREKATERHRRWVAANSVTVRAHHVKYRKTHGPQLRTRNRRYYLKNRDSIATKEKMRRSTKEGYIQDMINRSRCRSKKTGKEFNLTLEGVHWPTHCPVFGHKFIYAREERGARKHLVPSVDRIDNNKGYTLDNVQIISNLANVMKRDASPEQLKQFAHWVLES